MYSVKFKDFRCFGSTKSIEIRPLTFLVGENSAGKTSFLAGLRVLLEGFSPRSQNAFNRDPYFLGGFEQIAHYRGGRGGRARHFSLSLELPLPLRKDSHSSRPNATNTATHHFEFGKGYPQPELDFYSFSTNQGSVNLKLTEENPSLTVKANFGVHEEKNIAFSRSPSSSAIKQNASFIQFFIHNTIFDADQNLLSEKKVSPLQDLGFSESEAESFQHSFETSSRFLSQTVFASSPVRGQPFRTYTPSEIVQTSEGSHVPLELARTKQGSGDEWGRTKKSLEEFGRNSGLFTDIEVRQLGKSEIDPFQILVKLNGPSTNIMDVGYGVGRSLPIVYQLQNNRRYQTLLLQQPEVHLHPRAQAEIGTLLSQITSKKPRQPLYRPYIIVETHSDYIIDRIRIEIGKGNMNPEDAAIIFFQRDLNNSIASNIFFSKTGDIENPPDGFRNFFLQEHARLLGL